MKASGDRRVILVGCLLTVVHFYTAYLVSMTDVNLFHMISQFTFGSTLASMLILHVHEAAHGLVFGPNHVWKNRIYGLLLNLPLAIPVFGYWKRDHKGHHKHLGDVQLDVEQPASFEIKYFKGSFWKYVWLLVNPFIQLYRSAKNQPENTPYSFDVVFGFISILIFDLWLIYAGHFFIFTHLSMSTIMAMSISLVSLWGHTVHIEYFRHEDNRSYIGWLNLFLLNAGYHVEHHDFPNIPSCYLPEVSH